MPARDMEVRSGGGGVHAVGLAPTERLNLRRQRAAAAGKKCTNFAFIVHGVAMKLKKSSLPWLPSTGQKEYGQERGVTSLKKRG